MTINEKPARVDTDSPHTVLNDMRWWASAALFLIVLVYALAYYRWVKPTYGTYWHPPGLVNGESLAHARTHGAYSGLMSPIFFRDGPFWYLTVTFFSPIDWLEIRLAN